jgi:hypothetical protein
MRAMVDFRNLVPFSALHVCRKQFAQPHHHVDKRKAKQKKFKLVIMNNKLLRNLGGIMRAEIAAISFYLKVIDFFFLLSPHFSQHTVLCLPLPASRRQ